jgi:Arylsulfotransferase (ASST)
MKKFHKNLIIFWAFFFLLILAMAAARHVYTNGPQIKGTPKKVILFLSSIVSNTLNFSRNFNPSVIKNNFHLKNGFNYSANFLSSKDYLLLSVWDDILGQSIVKLVRINDGKELYRWVPDIDELIRLFESINIYGTDKPLSKYDLQLRHPFLNKDGSLIITIGERGIVRINNQSKLSWTNTTPSHHSIEADADGDYWICSYNSVNTNSEKYQIRDDAIQKISAADGKIVYEKSVFEILMENGYGRGNFFKNPVLSTNDNYLDYMHLNDVQPVLTDSKYWKKGDLFLSLRRQNLILLYRPLTNKMIWSQTGPWVHQHNVDVLDSTHIGVFGNNAVDAKFPNENGRLLDGHNTEYVIDFSKNECSKPYDPFFKSAKIGTYTEGRSRILSNGDIFVEETNHGRIIYGSQNEEIWSYVEQIDDTKLGLFNWSRYITEEEFNKFTFLNQPNK